MLINSVTGKLIVQDHVPDGKETYMSPVVSRLKDGESLSVIYGTGGETLGGSWFVADLNDLTAGDLSGSIRLDSSANKGFIGPPAVVDINLDGIQDMVVNAVDGRMIAVNGLDNSSLWTVKMANTEAYSSLGIGYFNRDPVPDFFGSYAVGVWPNLEWARQFMVDGKTGQVEFIDSLGYSQTGSPVVTDIDNDGVEEVLLSINYFVADESNENKLYHTLVVFDFDGKKVYPFGTTNKGLNLSSTPWLGDLDGDGLLDVVYAYLADANDLFIMKGLTIRRLATDIKINRKVRWGSYMGSGYDGIFEGK